MRTGRLAELLASAVKDERGGVWSLRWPEGAETSCLYEGWTDLLLCDGKGLWSPIQLAAWGQ
ncbi:MAG: hypothetical protein U0835_25960 [Isosphaeraceae bacterium]